MDKNSESNASSAWLDRPIIDSIPRIKIESLIIAIILLLAVLSRFAILGERVMSHDEVNHVVPSYELATGKGYRHDPVTHGPVQFHLVALSYFLFGDNDFTARVPAALYSIATVAFAIFGFRRYLGRTGAIIAGVLMLISPYMLFYGRYTRNEAFVALYGVLTLFAVLRYLEKGGNGPLYLLTAVTVLQFATKETAYIYTAQLLIFLAFLFMDRIGHARWPNPTSRSLFMTLLSVALVLIMITVGLAAWNAIVNKPDAAAEEALSQGLTTIQMVELGGVLIALGLGIAAIVILLRSIGWKALKEERSFDLLILVGSLILPLLTAFPVKIIGTLIGQNWNPIDYTAPGITRSAIVLVLLTIISFAVGFLWKPRLWLANFALFYGIFVVFYTTLFTNGFGFFTGIVGSLGYWLEQQGVHRGEQPFYYYALIQMPLYEYLAIFGSVLALYFGLRYNKFAMFAAERLSADTAEPSVETTPIDEAAEEEGNVIFSHHRPLPVLALLLFWSLTSLLAYTAAGEKMPWLTVHIAMPFLLTAGWGFGYLVETTPWHALRRDKSWIALLLLPVLLYSLSGVMGALLGAQPPFQGNTLEELRATSTFFFSALAFGFSAWGILRFLREWQARDLLKLFTAGLAVYLAIFTARTAATANYINYDTAKEFLVYAHAARGPKDILEQVVDISRRTTGGKGINVAYDNDALYPFWWYFRDYPNKRYFTDNVTRDLRDSPVIIAGEKNWSRLDSITRGNFVTFDYMRLWWPMQDYYNLTVDRVRDALADPEMRAALFKIWRDRDYSDYARLTNNEYLTLEAWRPNQRLRVYIRKDILGDIWNYGAAPAAVAVEQTDPYLQGSISLTPDQVIGQPGNGPGQFQGPRKIAFAPDGSIYVPDSRNHRIQHFSASGEFLQAWGRYGATAEGEAPGGTFNEPWSVAVAPDGSVFVADTWNHRVQKFSADGQFITMWGIFGQGVSPDAFWGPRDLAFDSLGRLYVTDTGNKRVAIFNQDGSFVSDFGTPGIDPGQFDEQVGIAINARDEIFIADTWNQRIQVLTLDPQTGQAIPLRNWEIFGWFGQSLENKPYLAVDNQGSVFVTDPEGYRVLQFTETGQFVRAWGDFSTTIDGFGLPSAVTVDPEGRIWVSDSVNNVLLRFSLPQQSSLPE